MRKFLFGLLFLLSSCSATVSFAPESHESEAKKFSLIEGKSSVYVIRDCPYGSKLHDVSIDNGVRYSLACKTFHLFVIEPGDHLVSLQSASNKINLPITIENGSVYFVRMGFSIGSGMGDSRVKAQFVSETAGKTLVRKSRMVSRSGL